MSRLAQARDIVAELRKVAPKVVVMLSGGKDALASLAMIREQYEPQNVAACFAYKVRGLPCWDEPVERQARHFGVDLVKLPHWYLARQFKHALFMPHRHAGVMERRVTEYKDIEAAAKARTGADFAVLGWRRNDSRQRAVVLKTRGYVDREWKRAYPIGPWRETDVHAYLRRTCKRWPLVPKLSTGRMGDFSLDGPSLLAFQRQCRHAPNCVHAVLEVYPYATVEIAAARRAEQVPERGHRDDAAGGAPQLPVQPQEDHSHGRKAAEARDQEVQTPGCADGERAPAGERLAPG